MFDITFLRHAESVGNSQGYLQGKLDSGLTDKGKDQVRLLAEQWKANGVTFDHIISSPLTRTRQTAEIIAETLALEVEYDPLWQERDFGILEGELFDDLRQRNPTPDYSHPYNPIGGTGESMLDVYIRACQGMQKLLRRPPGRYLVVSHGSFLTRMMYAILGITPQGHYNNPLFSFDNLTFVHFTYQPATRQWMLKRFTNPDLWSGEV